MIRCDPLGYHQRIPLDWHPCISVYDSLLSLTQFAKSKCQKCIARELRFLPGLCLAVNSSCFRPMPFPAKWNRMKQRISLCFHGENEKMLGASKVSHSEPAISTPYLHSQRQHLVIALRRESWLDRKPRDAKKFCFAASLCVRWFAGSFHVSHGNIWNPNS